MKQNRSQSKLKEPKELTGLANLLTTPISDKTVGDHSNGQTFYPHGSFVDGRYIISKAYLQHLIDFGIIQIKTGLQYVDTTEIEEDVLKTKIAFSGELNSNHINSNLEVYRLLEFKIEYEISSLNGNLLDVEAIKISANFDFEQVSFDGYLTDFSENMEEIIDLENSINDILLDHNTLLNDYKGK